jgi:chromosome segregation ATPase
MAMNDEVERGVRAFLEMRQELTTLQDDHAKLKADYDLCALNLSQTQQRLRTAELERDHYMRQVTELMTTLTTATSILAEAETKISQGMYRPNHHPAPRENGVVSTEDLDKLARVLNGDKSY